MFTTGLASVCCSATPTGATLLKIAASISCSELLLSSFSETL
eukprot:COSAG05_NODE_1589_length_4476_cov_118.433630_3_plen_42_part_00